MVLNIAGRNVAATLAFVGDTLRKFDPLHPFEFEFVDDALDRLYVADQRLTRLIAIFAGLGIFIACLGLFGLASFMAVQRTREIGVRKVFGARRGRSSRSSRTGSFTSCSARPQSRARSPIS